MPGNNLKLADDFAAEYDQKILNNNWNGPELIFSSSQTFLKPNSKLLDLGIGTGESSIRFQNAGHRIVGLDGAKKMLEQCRSKNIGIQHVQHDLEQPPFPFEKNTFDAVISNGVFHLIHPLKPVFAEVSKILKPNGIFTFTYENTLDTAELNQIDSGVWERKTESGVFTYKHSSEIIQNYQQNCGFETILQKKFLAFISPQQNKKVYFNTVVTRLNPSL